MGSDFPTIISFYTKTWTYPEHAVRLRTECENLGLNHLIKELPTAGSWIDNTRLKATFIYDTIKELQCPVLWIDVDGSIYRKPESLRLPVKVDFMGRHQRIGPKRNWHVGTLFFNYSPNILNFLERWKDASENGSGSDEASFENIWVKFHESSGITSAELPPEYFGIHGHDYNKTAKPVIVHRLSQCESKLASKRNK